jgi:hypothetical protein
VAEAYFQRHRNQTHVAASLMKIAREPPTALFSKIHIKTRTVLLSPSEELALRYSSLLLPLVEIKIKTFPFHNLKHVFLILIYIYRGFQGIFQWISNFYKLGHLKKTADIGKIYLSLPRAYLNWKNVLWCIL